MVKSTVKNVIIVILAVVCTALAVRVWFGSFSIGGIFSEQLAGSTQAGAWSDAAGAGLVVSARLGVSPDGQAMHYFYGNLDDRGDWSYINFALRQLIEGGEFVRSGLLAADRADPQGHLSISYNFAMPATFFRDFFGTRAGFLSYHFSHFSSLAIAPTQHGVLEFTFKTDSEYFVFALTAPALYEGFQNILTGDFEGMPVQAVTWASSIAPMSLGNVAGHISYLFPSAVSQSTINGIWTYSDNFRIARFFPNDVLEFNSMPTNPTGAEVGFIEALLVAYELIVQSTVTNDVILSSYHFDADSSRWFFNFDYVLCCMVVDLAALLPNHEGHALEIQVAGGEVLSYRRLMIILSEEHYGHR